jgi:hypothetical protein
LVACAEHRQAQDEAACSMSVQDTRNSEKTFTLESVSTFTHSEFLEIGECALGVLLQIHTWSNMNIAKL